MAFNLESATTAGGQTLEQLRQAGPTQQATSQKGFNIDSATTAGGQTLQDLGSVSDIARAEERTQARGSIDFQDIGQKLTSERVSSKLVGGLEAAGVPFQIAEAAISNPVLAARKGDFRNIPSSILEGLKGKQLGEFGDVLTSLGADETTSKIGGLAIDLVIGGAVIEQGIKAMRKGLVKKSDRIALSGTRDLIQGTDRASQASKAMTNQFWAGIDDVPADANKFIEIVDALPKAAVEVLEEQLGRNLDDIAAAGVKLSDVRQVRQIIGSLKPSAFGKEARGTAEVLSDIRINKAYGKTANFITDTLKENKLGGKAKELLDVNDAAEEVINASNLIKSKLVSGKGEIKTGTATRAVTTPEGASFQENLKALEKAGGPQAKRAIEKGLVKLRTLAAKQNRKQIVAGVARGASQAALIGAALKLTGSRRQ